MLAAPIPLNETERLASLRRMRLLDTPDEAAMDRVVRMARRLFGTQVALFSVVDENRQWFKSCFGLGVRETGRDISFCGHVVADGATMVVEDTHRDARFRDNPLVTGGPMIRFYAGRPIRNAQGHCVGTLCIIDALPRAFGTPDREGLEDLGGWLEMLLERRDLGEAQAALLDELDRAVRASLLDPLLGAWNRRGITDILRREVELARAGGPGIAVAVCDLDHFKRVNDTYGHPAGDAVLAEATRRLRGALRGSDALGRLGGEEFLAVLPGCCPGAADELGARLCRAVGGGGPILHDGHEISVTISVGIVHAAPSDLAGLDADALVAAADAALYDAKGGGRDRAVTGRLG